MLSRISSGMVSPCDKSGRIFTIYLMLCSLLYTKPPFFAMRKSRWATLAVGTKPESCKTAMRQLKCIHTSKYTSRRDDTNSRVEVKKDDAEPDEQAAHKEEERGDVGT